MIYFGILQSIQLEFPLLDWYSNPSIITVETTDYPIEKIPFPTITLCSEDNDPNGAQFITRILDSFEFPCYLDL